MVRSNAKEDSLHERQYEEPRNSFAQEHYTAPDGKYGTAEERRIRDAIKGEAPAPHDDNFSDSAIKNHLCDALNDDLMIDATHIDVLVHNGVVKLLGEVDDSDAKRAAEAYAQNQHGVVEVINELLVKKDFARGGQGHGLESW